MKKIIEELLVVTLVFLLSGFFVYKLNGLQDRINSLETLQLNQEILKVSHSLTKSELKRVKTTETTE